MPQGKRNPFLDLVAPSTPTPSPTQVTRQNPFLDLVGQETPNPLRLPQTKEEPGFFGSVVSTIAPVTEFLSRGQYASARFFDGLADENLPILDLLTDSAYEIYDPKYKLSFSDVITKRAPEFARNNPKSVAVLGFVADIALDPTSYLGIGIAGKGIKVGGQTLSHLGTRAIAEGVNTASRRTFVGSTELLTSLQKAGRKGNLSGAASELAKLKEINQDTVFDIAAKFGTEGKKNDFYQALKQLGNARGVEYFQAVRDRTEELVKLFEATSGRKIVDRRITFELADTEVRKELQRNLGKANAYFSKVDEIANKTKDTNFELFKYLKDSVAKKGKPGISIEKDAGIARVVKRDKDGNPLGILEMELKPDGQPYWQSVGVATEHQGKGIAKSLYSFAKKEGFDVDSASGASLYTPAGAKFAISRTRKDLGLDLTENEVRERIEERIVKLTELAPDLKFKLFETKGPRLTVGLPLTRGVDIPYSQQALAALGLNAVYKGIKSTSNYLNAAGVIGKAVQKGKETLGLTFNKNYGLPEEYIKVRTSLENEFDSVFDQTIRATQKLFTNIPEARRAHIGEMMYKIDDNTRILQEQLLKEGKDLTQADADIILRTGIQNAKLNPDEMSVVSSLYQSYKEAATLEMRAGLLKQSLINYSPRMYELLDDATEISQLFRHYKGLSSSLPAGKARKFQTLEEAKAAGFQPELDAAILYAQRMMLSQRTLAAKQFKDTTQIMFGAESLEKLPKRIIDDMKLIGDAVYPQGMNEGAANWLKAIDYATSIFRRGATIVKPSFAPKQAISNTFQSAMVVGAKAFKGLDPRAAIDASMLLFDRNTAPKGLPDYLGTFFSKYPSNDAILAQRVALAKITGEGRVADYAKDFKLRTALGQEFSGTELIELARTKGVIKGVDSTGDVFAKKVEKALNFNPNSVPKVAGELAKYWQWPSLTEDYSRMTLFLNGIRMGYSADESVKLVNKALFDYSRGLSWTEKNVIRRILLFYTFQRFALPLVFKETLKKPGNAATLDKTVKLFEKLLVNGESLTPAEQSIFGDSFLIEQPRVFKGFDKDGKATFNVFNNLTPLDTLSFFVKDKNGNVDYQRTAEKSILAAMTPFIKVPLETLLDKNFFTGRSVAEGGAIGKQTGISSVLPDSIKYLIGWEDRVNAQGKVTTYINPYLAHFSFNAVPALKQFIRPLDAGVTPLDATMDLLIGIGSAKMDLKEQQQWQALRTKKEVRELQSKIRASKIKGAVGDFEENLESLNLLMNTIKEETRVRKSSQVRGRGIAKEEDITSPTAVPDFK